VVTAAALHHVESKHRHHEERDRFHGGEDAANPQPVAWHADEEEVVPGAQDTGNQSHCDDDVQPLVNHFTVNTSSLDQHKSKQRAQNQFPGAFNPKVDDEPPVHLVTHQVVRVYEAEQEHQRQTPQAHEQYQRNTGLAPFQNRHADIEQKAQRNDDNSKLGGQWLFEEFPTHRGKQFIAG